MRSNKGLGGGGGERGLERVEGVGGGGRRVNCLKFINKHEMYKPEPSHAKFFYFSSIRDR